MNIKLPNGRAAVSSPRRPLAQGAPCSGGVRTHRPYLALALAAFFILHPSSFILSHAATFTTPYTRTLLRADDAATARTTLGVSGSSTNYWTSDGTSLTPSLDSLRATAGNLTVRTNLLGLGYVTLSGRTNRITDSGTALQYNGADVGSAGTVGTVINAGTPASGSVPKYTDTTGTNIGPSKVTLTTPATGSTLTIADGKTLTANNSITLAGTDATTMTFPTTSATIARTDAANTFTGTQTIGALVATTLTSPIGSAAAPSWKMVNFGLYENSALGLQMSYSSTPKVGLHYNGINTGSDCTIGWASTTSSTTAADLHLNRDAAATLQLGTDAATVTAQTLKAHDGSGTDKDGAKMNLNGGNSTGTGRGGSVFIGTSLTGSTGSSANSVTIREAAIAKPVTLTETTATTILNLAFGSSKYLGATIVVTVNAADATDLQSITSTLNVNAVNKSGTVTTTITQVDGTAAVSAGTLTPVTYTAVANGASVDIKCDATSSLTQTTLAAKLVVTALNSDGVVTITEQ